MNKLLLLACCSFLSAAAFAQSTPAQLTIKGIAIDSTTNEKVGYATAALQDANKQPVKSTLTKDDGSFELKAPANKPYTLVLIFVGYANRVIHIKAAGSTVDLGKILLKQTNSQLNQVEIVTAKPLMTQEVDRISYNVASDPESKSITALDMMRKVPLLTVDASDNITLKGSGNYKILVNGKESALLAKNPSDVLRSMPASNIVRIEVITTPPAKYDAEGLAGIINIITVKNADQGYNIGVNARYSNVWGPGINLNGTVKEGKFGFSGYAGTGRQNTTTNPYDNTQTFFADQSVLTQKGIADYNSNYKYFDGEFSYTIDSLNLLTAEIDFNNGADHNGDNGLTKTILNNVTTQQYNTLNNSTSKNTGIDANINYELGFKKSKEQLLTLSYRYSYSPDDEYNQNLFKDTINYLQPNFRQYNNSGERDHTIQVDYAQPFNKKISIEVGGKAIFRNSFSNFNVDTLVRGLSNQYLQNAAQTNDFNYHQDVYSLYNSYQLKLENWTGKAGLRLEETTVNADFSSVGATLNTSYGNLIPSISLQRKFKNSSINFGFTERIQRPSIQQLNPFVDESDPQFISSGNPGLKPELNHVFELNYSHYSTGSINTGFSYSFSDNAIQNVTSLKTETIDGKPDTVTYSTYQNLGSNRTLGYNINANFPVTKQLSVNINGFLNYVWLQGIYSGTTYKNSGFMGNMFTSIGYKFATGYRIGMNTGYFSGNINLQGKSSYFIFNSYVIAKEFLNKKASISLVANNPWSKYWQGTTTTTTDQFYQENIHEQTYRNVMVRVSYKFGKLNSDIKKNQHGIDNDDTQSNNKGTGNQ